MDREKTHRKIDELATLISVNNNRMMLHEERIPQLDIDLLRKNAIELYEAINMLHIQNLKDKRNAVLLEEATPEVEQVPEPIVKEVKPAVEVEQPAPKPQVEEVKEPEPKEEPEPPKEEPPVKIEPAGIKKVEVKEVKAEEKKKPAEQDKKTGDKQHLYEKLTRSSIESIKKAISISKRYEMQAALFKNDPDAYNAAINTLDNSDSEAEAMQFLHTELKSSYGWNDEDPLVEELIVLVERRYA